MTTPNDLAPGQVWRDDAVKGLMLRNRGRVKSWHLYYRTKKGQERRPKIGEYPTLQLKQARELAKDMLRRVWAGDDPSLERQVGRKASATVSELCDTYMEKHGNRKKTKRNDQSIIDNHVKPQLGGYAVAEVAPRHIANLHHKLSLTAPTQANRVIALLSKMFALAERWELRAQSTNPCRGVERNREKKRKRYMTPGEARAIAAVLDEREAEHRMACLCVRLLMLTGARRGEICGRKLRVIGGDEIYLSDSKTGEKTIQLPKVVVEIIEREGLDGADMPNADYVSHFWHDVCEAAGVIDLHLHDLRHTFASVGLSAGVALSQIGELLGHSSTQTTKRYAHLMKGAAKTAADLAGAGVLALLTGPALDVGADMVADGGPSDDDASNVDQNGARPADNETGALVG